MSCLRTAVLQQKCCRAVLLAIAPEVPFTPSQNSLAVASRPLDSVRALTGSRSHITELFPCLPVLPGDAGCLKRDFFPAWECRMHRPLCIPWLQIGTPE